MHRLRTLSLKQKLTLIIMLTSSAGLLLACAAFAVYELTTFRHTMRQNLETLAQVTGVRWRVEELFEDCKGHLGMADYEVRSWTSWHHHMALVAVAHLFLTLTRRRFKKRSRRSRCR